MADVKLNSLATKTNANAAAILVKDSATQNQGAEGWITKAQLSQIIRDEIKAQMSAITSGTPDVPVLDGSTLKYMTLANFAKVVGGQAPIANCNYIARGTTGNPTNEYVVFSVPSSRFSCTLLESSNQHAATYALSINNSQGLADAKKLTGNNAADIRYKMEDSNLLIAVRPFSNWSAVAMFGTQPITLGSNITDVTGYTSVTIS